MKIKWTAPILMPGAVYCNRTATRSRLRSGEHFLKSLRGLFLHVGEEVGVDVEGDRHGGVSEHLRDYFRVDVSGEEKRGAGVTEVVEPDTS